MMRLRSEETLAGGSALALLVALVVLALVAPSDRSLWLTLTVCGLVTVVAFLLRQFGLLRESLAAADSALDDRNVEIQQLAMELTEMNLVDPLTGARNRRGFIDLVEHQMRVATREWKQLHFILVDVDGMKRLNEVYGHQTGDSALIEVVQTIWASSRTVDIVGRMGGDEFAVALIHADDPSVVADRIRTAMAARTRDANHPYELQFSVGVATFDPATPVSIDQMLRSAHLSMYEERQAEAEARQRKLAAPGAR